MSRPRADTGGAAFRASIDGLRAMRIVSRAAGFFIGQGSMSLFLHGNFCRTRALLIAAFLALPAAEAREFRVADTQSEDYPTVQALLFMARIVEERTAGRHRISVFHSRQLGE